MDDRMVLASEDFIRVYVDCTPRGGAQERASRDLMKRFDVRGYPTVLFVSPSGEVLEKLCGNCSADEFLRAMAKVAPRWSPERRLSRALEGLGDLRVWMELRVERLGDADIAVREGAMAELESLRDSLDASLRLALESPDPERRERIRSILRRSETTAPSVSSPVPEAGGTNAADSAQD